MIVAALFIGGLTLLYLGGEALVRSASSIGVRIGMSPLIVGLTIVAFATSAPELAVALDAALRNEPGLAVGNVVGSNICNLTLVVGIVIWLARPKLQDKLAALELGVLSVGTLATAALLIDGGVSRIEGFLLLLGIAAYLGVAVWRLRAGRKTPPVEVPDVPQSRSERMSVQVLLCLTGVAALVLGSDWLVDACVRIATLMGISPAVVGLSAAAFGTSLPEIAASIVAARHRHSDLAIGNLIGSNIFNLLVVLGGTAVVRPLSLGLVTWIDIAIMAATTFLTLGLLAFRHRLSRWDGTALIAIYIGYIVFIFSPAA